MFDRNRSRWAALLSLVWLLAACAHRPNYFQPSERVSGEDERGNPVAIYTLRGPKGVFGEAKLWSRGATRAAREGMERTYLHVGVEMHNTGAEPLVMKRSDVRADVRLDDGRLRDLAPLPVPDLSVAPAATATWQLFFELPEEVAPRDVESFALRWEVGGATLRYAKRTLFLEREPAYDYYYHRGYVIYDMYHPHYWYYRRLGYCADPFCDTVYVYPRATRIRGNRTTADGRGD